jgi:predicted component of type VI protein secretion system
MNVKLLVVHGRPLGKSLSFAPGEFYFGRGSECQVRPLSEWVSRQHCLLRVTHDGVTLRDLGSSNGTLINGSLLTGEQSLQHGDQIQIGPMVFEVRMDAAPAPAATPAAPQRVMDADPSRRIPSAAEGTDPHPVFTPQKESA